MSRTYDPDDYYPAGKIYDNFEGILSEDSYWDSNMNRSLDHLKNKLDSSRIQNLDELWYSGFEDLELRKLERSLFAIRVIVNDIKRQEKELELWRIQHRNLKSILCEVDEILDDMALRAPQLKQVLQSHQVSPHPYLTAKLVELNNLILELNAIAAEIKSEVLPGFYTRKKPTAPNIQSNQSMAMTSHAPSVDKRNEFTEWKNNDQPEMPINYNPLLFEKFISELHKEKPQQFSHRQLKSFTSDFKCKIGSGAFGVVYKGEFSDGVQIAVKVLKNDTRDVMEMQFRSEVGTMGRTYHRNLIKLYGYCNEPDIMALVYEYMEKGSFDMILFKNHLEVPWSKLYDIAIEIALGISYLHESCHPQIIHHDIKPDNVLLDSNLSPRLTDFGVAKLNKELKSQFTQTRFRGTDGYAAPEVCLGSPVISCKCDVYSFGMMLFDILGSKKNSGRQRFLPGQVWGKYQKEQLEKFITDCGIGVEDEDDAKRLCEIALKCVEHYPGDRPSMSNVVKMLENEMQPEKPVNVFPYDDVSGESSARSGSTRNSRGRTRRMADSTYDERPLQNHPIDQKNKAVKSDSHQSTSKLTRSIQKELKNDFKKVSVSPDAASSEGGESELTIESFEKRCPPGGENSVVFYTTTNGTKKRALCENVHSILRSHQIQMSVRDLYGTQGYSQEFWDQFGNTKVPVLFVKGRLIGGADEVMKLEEEGKLVDLFAGIPKVLSAQGVKQNVKEASSKAVTKEQEGNIKEVSVSRIPQSRKARESESMLETV